MDTRIGYGKPISVELARIEAEFRAEAKRVKALRSRLEKLVDAAIDAEDRLDRCAWDIARAEYLEIVGNEELPIPGHLQDLVRGWK